MNCREAVDHLYEYLDQELTAELEREVRAHISDCAPCMKTADFEQAFLTFLQARCRNGTAPPELRKRILEQIFSA
jgi:anti-sigma factor (TIGR02949 family)